MLPDTTACVRYFVSPKHCHYITIAHSNDTAVGIQNPTIKERKHYPCCGPPSSARKQRFHSLPTGKLVRFFYTSDRVLSR